MTNPLDSAFPLGYLTKREFFAAFAMNGLLLSGGYKRDGFSLTMESVLLADSLIQTLNTVETSFSVSLDKEED